MASYHIGLREIRLATGGTDDVALFDVRREGDGETWIVSALLSPLFRLINMHATMSQDSRRAMVAGLGAQAIVDALQQGATARLGEEPFLLGLDYPGAPGEPDPLPSFEELTVEVEEHPSS